MSASAQMKWSALVDELTANATKFERKEQTVQEYSANYKRLIKELADEIRTKPYVGTTSLKVVVYRKNLFWRVKLVAANGEILMVSETYYSRSNAVRAAQRLRELLGANR
jgi:uncharacterized protein YegP (UPF0339 family)